MQELLLPLFPLEVVLFPRADLALHIFEDRYKELIADCLEHQWEFGVVLLQENSLANIGCTAAISEVARKYDDGRMDIVVRGRAGLKSSFSTAPSPTCAGPPNSLRTKEKRSRKAMAGVSKPSSFFSR